MISLAYFGLVRPLNSMGLNRMELLNEFIILILSDLMVFFTDYCYDSQIKQIAGWINIFIISTYCICLVYAMTYDSIRKVYLKKQVKINQTYKSIITKLSKKLDFLKKKEKKEVKLPTLTQYTATENINDLSFGSAAVDIIRTPNAGGEMPKFIIPLL
jgi:predicted membrane protein